MEAMEKFQVLERRSDSATRQMLFAGAALYLTTNRSTHPLVETGKNKRGDGLPQEVPGSHEDGQQHFESSGRKLTR